jgi:guanylate kinase
MQQEKGLLIVLSGPTGSGKGTVRKIIEAKKHFEFSVSATTRALREGEVNGVDYITYTHDEFRQAVMDGEMLEYTEYCGNFYGTPKAPVLECLNSGRDMLLEIEVEGAKQIKRAFPEAVLVMLLPPSYDVQCQRLVDRGTETREVIERRLSGTREELRALDIYDYVIYNYDDGQERAADDFLAIVRAEKKSLRRRKDVYKRYFGDE